MPRPKKVTRQIVVADAETDPFLYGRKPEPFAWGFFDGSEFRYFWGSDCTQQFIEFLHSIKTPLTIYMHNGGKFDFFYFLPYLSNPVKIINGRIVCASLGIHEVRDSYAIIPVPLAAYQKDEIDYECFESDRRESHKKEIIKYLHGDCKYLYVLVSKFNQRFGDRLTIGGTAMSQLKELHDFRSGDSDHDEKFRPFYFGGRVEAFKLGEFDGQYKCYDVNSMYPHAMRNYLHPISTQYVAVDNPRLTKSGDIDKFQNCIYFLQVEGYNYGAFATREKNGLNFNVPYGTFFVTSHEMKVALKHGIFKPVKTHVAYIPCYTGNFAAYVDKYYAEKVESKKNGDAVNEIFAKLLLNSAYGKFAQNPENYFDWLITSYGTWPDEDGWELHQEFDAVFIFRRKTDSHRYFDVAIAASITGAARSILLDAIQTAKNPIYCDTDSLICESLGQTISDTELGAWKHEGTFTRLCVAGKKMYAGIGVKPNGKEFKKIASKGIKATFDDVLQITRGDSFEWRSMAPNFKLTGEVKFTKRTIRRKI